MLPEERERQDLNEQIYELKTIECAGLIDCQLGNITSFECDFFWEVLGDLLNLSWCQCLDGVATGNGAGSWQVSDEAVIIFNECLYRSGIAWSLNLERGIWWLKHDLCKEDLEEL